jgi:tripartite-type tricarboxylate transporter receptor subunit TctC
VAPFLRPSRPAALRAAFLAACLGLSPAASAPAAAAWPERPLKLVVPFSEGGASGFVVRAVVPALSAELGQPVEVEYKPGGNTVIGVSSVASAAPDGYTLLLSSVSSNAIAPALYSRLPYDGSEGFEHVAVLAAFPSALVVRGDSGYGSLAALLDAARARPNAVRLGAVAGYVAINHVVGNLIERAAGVDFDVVDYRTAHAAEEALFDQRRADAILTSVPGAAVAAAGRGAGVLAVTSSARSPLLPDVPSLSEAGVAVDALNWYGLAMPRGAPPEAVGRLAAAAAAALASPAVRAEFERGGMAVPDVGPPQDFARAEAARWAHLVRRAGSSLDE